MASLDGQASTRLVQAPIRLPETLVDQARDVGGIADLEGLLTRCMRPANTARLAGEADERTSSKLPPYDRPVSG